MKIDEIKLDELTIDELRKLQEKINEVIISKMFKGEEFNIISKTFTIINNEHGQHVYEGDYEVCLIEEFFKNEQMKPPHMRSNSCLISCPCSKHRVIC